MPRSHSTPKIIRYKPNSSEQSKTRYATKRAAENAIKDLQMYHLDLNLRTYQSPTDGGWYLTRQRLEK
ncbi:MAG: hypothetical protein KA604_03320 [Candidatus Saccharimonas sp.]|jgi:hypothetical protein|nr:hypothetical protein [Candidatus Saccharimonas sp.]